MEKLNHTIRINSKNDEELLHPSELLLPLNGMVNLINSLEYMEVEYKKYEMRPRMRNSKPDFQFFIQSRLLESRHRIKSIRDNNCVTIKAMSKKSPYWVDLMISASPYVLETLNLLIDQNQEALSSRLVTVLDRIRLFDNSKNQLVAKYTIRCFQLITRYVNISIDRN